LEPFLEVFMTRISFGLSSFNLAISEDRDRSAFPPVLCPLSLSFFWCSSPGEGTLCFGKYLDDPVPGIISYSSFGSKLHSSSPRLVFSLVFYRLVFISFPAVSSRSLARPDNRMEILFFLCSFPYFRTFFFPSHGETLILSR